MTSLKGMHLLFRGSVKTTVLSLHLTIIETSLEGPLLAVEPQNEASEYRGQYGCEEDGCDVEVGGHYALGAGQLNGTQLNRDLTLKHKFTR